MPRSTWPLLLAPWLAALGCAPGAPPAGPVPVEAPGLHNVFRLNDRLYSGSSPDGERGLASLRRLGIRTVLSVDGARPDVQGARRHGLRYVHLPVGYDGVPEAQAWRIARAVRDLPGPVYVHCHHGRHRGPAAAAVARLCLEGSYDAEAAAVWLRRAGTDPRYVGLYASPRSVRRPTRDELDRTPADFPETAPVPGLARVMVEVDRIWEHLRHVRAAGWLVPADHPDLDPAHEAVQLGEQYREAGRLPEVGKKPTEFRRWLAEAAAGARELEEVLRAGSAGGRVDGAAAERAFRQAGAACARCHARYRDVPQAP